MSISMADAQAITAAFVRNYPGAGQELAYRLRATPWELYGARSAELPPGFKGGYVPKETIFNGKRYHGRVDIPLEHVEDAKDFVLTLRHEVLGHYGVNTFRPEEKRALLNGLIAAKDEPSLKAAWADIDTRYAGRPLDIRAEEVWALFCEDVSPELHKDRVNVLERGMSAFTQTCLDGIRPLQASDLRNIVYMVAQGVRDLTRRQQTFPQLNGLLREEQPSTAKAGVAIDAAAVMAIQSVLNAPSVTVYTAGRMDLAGRPSLQFVADEAIQANRAGFALAAPEKYALPGGLEVDEVQELFRCAAGLRAERVLRESALAWARGGTPPKSGAVSPVLAKAMSQPVSVAGLQGLVQALQAGMARVFGETQPLPRPVSGLVESAPTRASSPGALASRRTGY